MRRGNSPTFNTFLIFIYKKRVYILKASVGLNFSQNFIARGEGLE